jgi:hypothetical protein
MSEAISGEVVVTPSNQVNALDRLVGRWKFPVEQPER